MKIRHKRDGTKIEDLTYVYHTSGGKLVRNRLYHLDDVVGSGVDATDIDDMGTFVSGATIETHNNYSYDEEGRLIKDSKEGISKIVWRVDGKVKEIQRGTGSTKWLRFDYDAMGNRIAKHVYNNTGTVLERSTYYILDAQGNQISTYDHEVVGETAQFNLKERNIFGSSRIGSKQDSLNVLTATISQNYTLILGNKYYEFTNHLGNVLTVFNDLKIPLDTDSNSLVDNYLVGITNSSDYSPFGVLLDGRSENLSGYRYGFNGMESDPEFKGQGNSYTTEFRQYDPRIGRWLTIDPVVHHNQSPYCAMDNNPVYLVDPFGTNAGDYYSKEGEHLGSDGYNDNKVYVADGVDNSKNGKEKFTNAKDLGVTHDTFKSFAGVVDQESSGNKTESLAIGTAIVNASNNGGQSIESLIANSNFTKAILSSNYKTFITSPDNDKYGLSSAVNAFLYKLGNKSAIDHSKGAVLWEGGEFAAKGATHHKAKFYGIDVPTYHWNQLKTYYETTGKTALKRDYGADKVADISTNMNPRGTAYWLKATNYDNRLLLKSTAVHGGTIFFGKNTGDPRNSDYNWKYLSLFPK